MIVIAAPEARSRGERAQPASAAWRPLPGGPLDAVRPPYNFFEREIDPILARCIKEPASPTFYGAAREMPSGALMPERVDGPCVPGSHRS